MKVWTFHKNSWAGAARLSSACTLRRSVQSGNMRNPYSVFQVSQKTARDNLEEGGDDAKSAWPFDILGGTHVTMQQTTGCKTVRLSQSLKLLLSSD